MSSGSSSGSENSYDAEELFQIRKRWKELRKEKDMWKGSQSQSFELIRRLELHSKTLSEAQTEDKKRIEQLERELLNCSQEIEYLQDQLNARNIEVNCLDEHVSNLQLKVAHMEYLEEEVIRLSEELKISNSDRSFLVQELENKEVELRNAVTCIDKLEESISSSGLEYQCEIASMRLDLSALQKNLVDARKARKETALENVRMSNLVQDLESQIQEEKNVIECLENEKKDLCEKLQKAELDIKQFYRNIDEQFQGWPADNKLSFSEVEEDTRTSAEFLGLHLSKPEVFRASDTEWRENTDAMLQQICEYELLVSHLKEELKEEKFKAKEEAEDLAQEMAELRYQMTGLLEDECKRRACVEQKSLQRIAELEAELEKERSKFLEEHKKSITIVQHTHRARTSLEKT